MNVKTHHTDGSRASYVTLNDPGKASNRSKSVMLSKNPIARSTLQILHRDKQTYVQDILPSNNNLNSISDTVFDRVRIYREIQEQLPDIKAAKRIRTSMILSPNDLMTLSLNYTCENSFLPPELVRKLLEVVKSVFDSEEYPFKNHLKEITDDVTVDTGSYALAVIPEPAINDIINASDTVALENLVITEIRKIKESNPNYNMVFGACESGFTHIKCDDNKRLFDSKKNGEIKRSDILNYNIVEDIGNIQIRYLKGLKNHIRMSKRYSPKFEEIAGFEGLHETIFDNVVGVENNNQLEINKFKNEIFHYKPSSRHEAIKVDETDWSKRPAVGHPLTFHYPSQSVIPIHVPGNPAEHIGYLVLTGDDNNPLTTTKNSKAFDDFLMGIGTGATSSLGSNYKEVISSISRYQEGQSCDYGRGFNPTELLNIAKRIIEDDVTERLYNGTYSSSAQSISCPENVALIMLSYRLADMQVNLQFIPASLMTYFALDYDELGIGRSCLEDVKLIASLRSSLQLADTMAGIKNSIGNTKLNINVDALAPNVTQTVESLIQRVASVRAMTPILGNNPPNSIAQFMASAFMQVQVTADGASSDGMAPIPETRVEVTEEAPNYPGPSDELKDDLRTKSLLGVGVPAELVDAASGIDFATTIIYSNLMLNKQTLEDQNILNTHITKHIRQFTMNSGRLMSLFVEAIRSEKETIKKYFDGKNNYTVKQLIDEFINHISVKLPEPNNTKHAAQLEAVNSYISLVDVAIQSCITDGMIGKIIESVNSVDDESSTSTTLEQMANIIKMNLVRRFMQSNGILPELFNLFDDDDDSTNLSDIISSMVGETDVLMEAFGEMKKIITEKIEVLKTQNNAYASPSVGSDSDSYAASNTDGEFGNFDEGNNNTDSADLGLNDSFNIEKDDNTDNETTKEEKKPEETEETTKQSTEEEESNEPIPAE